MAVDIGDEAKLSAHFQTDGEDVDPATVKCAVLKPSGTTTTYTFGVDPNLTKRGNDLSPGRYVCAVVVDEAGLWRYRWESTEPRAAEESEFVVTARRVG